MSYNLTWSPSETWPTSTSVLTLIATSHVLALLALLSNAYQSLATVTAAGDLVAISRNIRGAEASLTVISAEEVMATATGSVVAQASEAIVRAMANLDELAIEENLYGYNLNHGGNIFFFIVFILIFLLNAVMVYWSTYHWYNVTFVCGYCLQFLGFLGRVLAFSDTKNINYYLLQYVCLTILPAFIMGGVYFLFAQNVVVHGRQYSVLKPMWYSYFFVACDVFSLVIQGIGGGMASAATHNNTDPQPGTWVMFGGILFQVVCMTIFLVFWFEFVNRIYFKDRNLAEAVASGSSLRRRTVGSVFKLAFNTTKGKHYREHVLEQFYNPKYASIRARPLVVYYPAAISIGVVLIYIRCVYRVVELQEGFSGYLITNEVFIMTLDALMIALAGIVFAVFHPVFVFGKTNVLRLATIKKNHDLHDEEGKEQTSVGSAGSAGSLESDSPIHPAEPKPLEARTMT